MLAIIGEYHRVPSVEEDQAASESLGDRDAGSESGDGGTSGDGGASG